MMSNRVINVGSPMQEVLDFYEIKSLNQTFLQNEIKIKHIFC